MSEISVRKIRHRLFQILIILLVGSLLVSLPSFSLASSSSVPSTKVYSFHSTGDFQDQGSRLFFDPYKEQVSYRILNEETTATGGLERTSANEPYGPPENPTETRRTITEQPLVDIHLEVKSESITESQYGDLEITGIGSEGEPVDLATADITYSSSHPDIIRVETDSGSFKALAAGEAVLTADVTLDGTSLTGSIDVQVLPLTSDKTRSTYYTEEKVTNARNNAARFDWAKNERDSAVARADTYVALGYDYLWNLVTPQTLPRSYGVNQQLGSPVTGKEIDKYGNYPYTANPVEEPWKITDPSSGYKFPTNDFGAFYESGLDEHGIFREELADRSLLVNELYPERGPTWGVDDGNGWVDEDGNYYTFVAYYIHWHLWHGGIIRNALEALTNAYIYTGDMKYARAGIILLDRIADVYPDMDVSAYDASVYLNSHGGRGTGKVIGSIWETSLVQYFLRAYDAFFPVMDDDEVLAFLGAKGELHKLSFKDSAAGLRKNVEDGIVREVYPGVKTAKIVGNFGFHQSALALAAVVMDTLPETQEWIDFNFQTGGNMSNPWRVTGGNILTTLVDDVDRDGHGNESAPGYNVGWLSSLSEVANIMQGYDLYPAADLYDNAKFRKMFASMYPLILSERYTPTIGDSGSAGKPGIVMDKMPILVRAFETYQDPIFAQLAYFMNNNRTDGIHGDIFSPNPDAVAEQIQAVIDSEGPLELDSSHLTGYGFSALRDGVHDKNEYGLTYMFLALDVTESSTDFRIFDSNATVQLEANEPGHHITFAFDVPAADDYEIQLKPWRAPSYGKYSVEIDGQPVAEVDFYGSAKEPEALATIALDEGTHHITFRNTGKNDAATNYKMGVTQLILLTEEDKENLGEPRNTLRDLWMYYGRNTGHGHKDTLNIGLHAFGLDLAPDLGYPEFADSRDMHRAQWVNNTISHNTVVVDKRKQSNQWVSIPKHLDSSKFVQLIDVEAPKVYSQTSQYRRTTAMIQADEQNSYTVDFFRVAGGSDHHFSFHGAEGDVSVEGVQLIEQPTGTYAGPDVEFGERIDDVDGPGYQGSGFHWLKNVERDSNPESQFSIDWHVKDTWNVYGNGASAPTDTHLRLTMLGEMDEVSLADGVPPRNKPGNPASIRYMIAHRNGDNLDSLFTSVIEPYQGERFIESIEQAELKMNGTTVVSNEARAVKVRLKNGRTDYIVYSQEPDVLYTVDDKLQAQGFFGVYSEQDGNQVYSYIHDGSYIGPVEGEAESKPASLHGTIADFTRELSTDNHLDVQMNLQGVSLESLVGSFIHVDNDGNRNASYPIQDAAELNSGVIRLSIGDKTPIRSYVDADDFSQGFIYDIAENSTFVIPLTYDMEASEVGIETISQKIDGYEAAGELRHPLVTQLRNSIRQASHHWNGGRPRQAVKSLDDSLYHLDNKARSGDITAEAKASLTRDIKALILQWDSQPDT